jgi:FkbM family methyltransferase
MASVSDLRSFAVRLATWPMGRFGSQPQTKIVLVDVGASKGVQRKWLPYRRSITPVLFEPNPVEAEALRATLKGFSTAYIIDRGLSDETGPKTLHIAEYFGCTSMMDANMDFLDNYSIGSYYRPKREIEVECVRYDELVSLGEAPQPDVVKIDIEGYESHALAGFGNLLHNVLGIETEAWLYPAFREQALLHDIVRQLSEFGFRLRRLETVPGFNDDLVCVNAFFTQQQQRVHEGNADRWAKFQIMSKVWKLNTHVGTA